MLHPDPLEVGDDPLGGPAAVGGVSRMPRFGGTSLKKASKASLSTVSSATSFSASAVNLSRWVTRTSIARS
jgi:hypothetical protein